MNENEYGALIECCHLSEKSLTSPGIAVCNIGIFKAQLQRNTNILVTNLCILSRLLTGISLAVKCR